MKTLTATRARSGAVALAPAVMFVALVTHPYLARLPDAAGVAAAVEGQTTRWGVVHLLTSVGSTLVAVAFLALRAHLRDAGEDRSSVWGLPLVIFGSGLYALLPGLEFAPLAAARTGGDAAAAQDSLQGWFVLILAVSAITFAAGLFGFAKGIVAAEILGRPLTLVVVTALGVLAASRFVPLGVAQFYAQAVAGLVALWPLAYQMWRQGRAPLVAPTRRAAVAS
jgi:hypothetical protein